jgi:sugar phosphate permease
MNALKSTNLYLDNKNKSRLFYVFIWLLYVLVYMTKNCFSGALSIIRQEGTLTLTQTTWIITSFYIVYTPLQIVGGRFADKYSPEKLILISLLGGALSNLVIYFNQNFWVMLTAWSFNAAIQFSLWPAVYKIVSSQLAVEDRSKMVFGLSFCSAVGLVISYAVAAFVTRWQYNFLISAIILVALAVILVVFCVVLRPSFIIEPFNVKPVTPKSNSKSKVSKEGAFGIFLASGFIAILPAVFFRTLAENGSKTLSPTMLSDLYANLSAQTGNLLNILIIIAAPLGMILVKTILFPRIVKNEMVMFLILFCASMPFVATLMWIGSIPVWLAVVCLCMVSLTLSGTQMLTQFINLKYVKYGLNGTAAGVLNFAASFGFAVQYCLFGSLADAYGWRVVTIIWTGVIALGVFFILIAIKKSIAFAKNEKDVSLSLEENND